MGPLAYTGPAVPPLPGDAAKGSGAFAGLGLSASGGFSPGIKPFLFLWVF